MSDPIPTDKLREAILSAVEGTEILSGGHIYGFFPIEPVDNDLAVKMAEQINDTLGKPGIPVVIPFDPAQLADQPNLPDLLDRPDLADILNKPIWVGLIARPELLSK